MSHSESRDDRSRYSGALLAVACLCAVVVTALVVRRELRSPVREPVQARAVQPAEMRGWRSLAESGRSVGPDSADVTMVVFADFQCPACRRLATYLRALRAEFPGRLRYVHRHFPLSRHPHARPAAHAAECAARQDRFGAMQRTLYREQPVLGHVAFSYFAELADVPDLRQFERCMDGEMAPAIRRDLREGRRHEVDATPTLILQGKRFDGVPPYGALRDAVRSELDRAEGRSTRLSEEG